MTTTKCTQCFHPAHSPTGCEGEIANYRCACRFGKAHTATPAEGEGGEMSNEAELLAAARRRAAGHVDAWRQECQSGWHRPFYDDAEMRGEPGLYLDHRRGCPGWQPGVKAVDGSTREIEMQDVLAAVGMSESDGLQITAGNHYVVMAGAAFYEPSPDALLLAALEAFSAAQEAQGG